MWAEADDLLLIQAVGEHGTMWKRVAQCFPPGKGITVNAVRMRWKRLQNAKTCEKNTLSDVTYSDMKNDDWLLIEAVKKHGTIWKRVAQCFPPEKGMTDDAVRMRWKRLQRKKTCEKTLPTQSGQTGERRAPLTTEEEDDVMEVINQIRAADLSQLYDIVLTNKKRIDKSMNDLQAAESRIEQLLFSQELTRVIASL